MKHCSEFKPMDIWVLVDNEKFTDRKLSFGICPVCSKPVAILIQFNCVKNCFESIKKIGIASQKFVESFQKQIYLSAKQMHSKKLKDSTYKWVYGVNKNTKNKTRQYAKDFFGNTKLVKEY